MNKKLVLLLFSFFLIASVILVSASQVKEKPIVDKKSESFKKVTDVPTKWKDKIEITDKKADMKLYKVQEKEGKIHIKKSETDTHVLVNVKLDKSIIDSLENYDGKQFAVLHIEDDGSTTYKVITTKEVLNTTTNKVTISTGMSEVVIGGAVGYYQTQLSGSLANRSINIDLDSVTEVYCNITSPPTYGKIIDYVPGINDTMPVSGAIAWWRFDEGTGSTAYNSIDNNNMALTGSYTWLTNYPNTYNKSVRYSGGSSYASTSAEYSQVSRTKNFTVCALVNATDVANSTLAKKIFSTGVSTSDRFSIVIRSSKIMASIYDGSSSLYRTEVSCANGDPFFVAATYKYNGTGTLTLYVDDAIGSASTVSAATDYGVIYVKPNTAVEDNVMIFDRTLTKEEVMNVRHGFDGIRATTYPGGNVTPIQSGHQHLTSGSNIDRIDFLSNRYDSYSGSLTAYFQNNYTIVREWDNATHHKIDLKFTATNNITAGHLDFVLNNATLLDSPTLKSNQSGSSVSLDGNDLTVNIGTLSKGQSRYFNVSMKQLGYTITDVLPNEGPVEVVEGNNIDFVANTSSATDIEWYVNGTLVETDHNTTSGNYTKAEVEPGIFNITAKVFGDQKSWELTITPLSILQYNPDGGIVNVTKGDSQTLSVFYNGNTNSTWKLNSVTSQFNVSVTNASYTFSSNTTGSYNLTVLAHSTNKKWTINVIPVEIEEFSPSSSNIYSRNGSLVYFNANLTGIENIQWLVNNAIKESETNDYSEYMFYDRGSGTYNITARIPGFQQSWSVIVTSSPWNYWINIDNRIINYERGNVSTNQYMGDMEIL